MGLHPEASLMTNKLARGFDTVLMRYLSQLLCFEVKPSSLYRKSDYIRLLVNSSVLNTYAEGMSNVSNKAGAMVPNADTALLYFKTIDRHELQSAVSMVPFLTAHRCQSNLMAVKLIRTRIDRGGRTCRRRS